MFYGLPGWQKFVLNFVDLNGGSLYQARYENSETITITVSRKNSYLQTERLLFAERYVRTFKESVFKNLSLKN